MPLAPEFLKLMKASILTAVLLLCLAHASAWSQPRTKLNSTRETRDVTGFDCIKPTAELLSRILPF